jgi:homoserine dehydrogenase
VRLEEIPTAGIRDVSQLDIAYAREFGYAIKLLAVAKEDRGGIEAWVQPAMVPRTHLLADVNGALNAISVRGAALGASMYLGLGAGMMPTATAVVADLIEAARHRLHGSRGRVAPLGYPVASQRRARIKPLGELRSEYYLRFMAKDRPGVLSQIAGILGAHGISIASVIQRGRELSASVPVVIRTHEAREDQVRRALRRIDRLSVVRREPASIRIEHSLGH